MPVIPAVRRATIFKSTCDGACPVDGQLRATPMEKAHVSNSYVIGAHYKTHVSKTSLALWNYAKLMIVLYTIQIEPLSLQTLQQMATT